MTVGAELAPRRAAVCSIREADEVLLQEPRFATETVIVRGVPVRRWVAGPKTVEDVVTLYRRHGDRDFLVDGVENCTYRGAVAASEAAAHALLAAGLEAGDRVAILMRNRLEWPVWFLAAIRAGGIAVPLNGWATPAEMLAMLTDCGAHFLVSDRVDIILPDAVTHIWTAGLGDKALGSRATVRSEDVLGPSAGWNRLSGATGPLPEQHPDDIAAIFYTSGTTSTPKGATITHRALTATIKNGEYGTERTKLRFPDPPGTSPPNGASIVALFPVPLFHVTGAIPGLIASSAMGAKIVLMRKWNIAEALDLIARERITLIGGVPTIPLQLLSDSRCADHDLSSLAAFSFGGAPAPSHLPGALAEHFHAQAATGWGMTETAATFVYHSGPEYRLRPASCGVAVPVNEVRIADENDGPLAIGQVGELQVRGLNVTQGYWNRPETTSQAFAAEGWFRTGDIARLDEEGFVTIVDRAKDVIIRGGENIACIEIEDVLCGHGDVVEAAVVGRAHALLGEEPIAFVTLAPGAKRSGDALGDYVARRLARHKVPAAIIASHEPLPRNPAGKVMKSVLRAGIAAAGGEHG